jgi:hypothetical protein
MGWTPPHLSASRRLNWVRDNQLREESTMKIIRVGVDLAKSVFQVHRVDRCEKVVWRRS